MFYIQSNLQHFLTHLLALTILTLIPGISRISYAAISQEGDVFVGGGGGSVNVGFSFDGSLTVTPSSSLTSSDLRIGINQGVNGTATLDNAIWTNFGVTTVGQSGTGELTLKNGAEFTNQFFFEIGSGFSSTGKVTVAGAGTILRSESSSFTIGDQGGGELVVSDGGFVSTREGILGRSGGDGTSVIEGDDSQWDIGFNVSIGQNGRGDMVIRDGGSVRSAIASGATAFIGQSFSNSTVQVTGNGSSWDHSGDMVIAEQGAAIMFINDGGRVTSTDARFAQAPGSNAFVQIDGIGSDWTMSGLFLAQQGDAEIVLTNGASLSSSSTAIFGGLPGSFGRMQIDGLGTRWHKAPFGNTFIVGNSGVGELFVTNGAYHSSEFVVLGQQFGGHGEVLVDGSSSRWNVSQELLIGDSGTGKVSINNGARLTVTGNGIRIGPSSDLYLSAGTVTVQSSVLLNQGVISGAGTINGMLDNANGQIRVNNNDQLILSGPVNNFNGGRIDVISGELEARDTFDNQFDGVVTGENSTFRFSNMMTNGGAFAVTLGLNRVFGDIDNSGQMILSGNSQTTFHDDVINSGSINVTTGSIATFLGDVSGNGVGGAGTVFLEGDILPGFSPGEMNFGGDVTLGDFSHVTIEMDGTTSGTEFDQLNTAGTFSLGGELTLQPLSELTAPGTSVDLTIFTANTLSGNFDSIPSIGEHLGYGVIFDGITYDAINGLVQVSLTQSLTADFNLDNLVNGGDLSDWETGFGTSSNANLNDGDANFDSDVDGGDFLAWQRNFGNTLPAELSASTATVPEPSSVILVFMGLAFGCLLTRRHYT